MTWIVKLNTGVILANKDIMIDLMFLQINI